MSKERSLSTRPSGRCSGPPCTARRRHGALQFHGKAHSLTRRVPFWTVTRAKPFEFRGTEFVPVPVPPLLRALPDLGGGWEEIWRSLESVEFFDLDAVIEYAFKLESAVTVAKIGFYLDRLRERAPRRPMYLERGKREPGKLLSRWNLVVPERILNRGWAEVT